MTDFLQRMIAAKIHSTGVIRPHPRPLFETRILHDGAGERAVAGNSDTGTGGSGQVPPPQKTGRAFSQAMPSRKGKGERNDAGTGSPRSGYDPLPDKTPPAAKDQSVTGTDGSIPVPAPRKTGRVLSPAMPSPGQERDDTRTGPPRSGYDPLPEKTFPATKDPIRNDRDGKDAPGKDHRPETARHQKSPRSRSTPEQQDEPAPPGSRKRHPADTSHRRAEDRDSVTHPAKNPGAPPAVTSRQDTVTVGLTVRDRPGRPGDPREKESGSGAVMPSRSPRIHEGETPLHAIRPVDYASSRTYPQEPPVIRVSIGRIEVRTETQAPVSQPVPVKKPVPRLSLDDYLRSRRGDTS
jgi:hypothetical protein